MTHFTVTPEPKNRMPKQQGLLRRGARFYTNIKVPKDLKAAMGREHIRESLGTSDYREACRRAVYQNMRWRTVFDDERRKLAASTFKGETRKRVMLDVSEREAHEIAARHLIALERRFREWWERQGLNLDSNELQETVFTASDELTVYSGGLGLLAPEDGSSSLRAFLAAENIECPPTSPAFQKLRPLFRALEAEHAARKLDVLEGRDVKPRDTHFRDVFAHSPLPDTPKGMTLGEWLERFAKIQKDMKRSEGTLTTYEIPARILREVLGADTLLSSITRESIEHLCDLLRKAPVNASQRYPGLTLAQAIEAADKANDTRRLQGNTLANYFHNIVTVFNFAVEEGVMAANPAKARRLRQSFADSEDGPKELFTLDELNALFRAPLYTGCVDDVRGYAKHGPNRPRRGRFWVPLLALFHGFRLNEVCQLYTEDVKERDGIIYIAIRAKREDGSKCDKRLKTKQSERDVPLHPALVRFGFLDYVAKRRKDRLAPRLFPELLAGSTGYYSNSFSKFFGHFKTRVLGRASKASFHSFRHHFRDATRAARLPAETVAMLAGWEDGESSASLTMNRYGRGKEFFRVLAEDIAKIEFPGLDLSHLTREQPHKSRHH